jgi:flagellar biosynthetic protein FliR
VHELPVAALKAILRRDDCPPEWLKWVAYRGAGALQIALPGITALVVSNLAFGLISRSAPTLNIFSVGFPISLVFGLLVLQFGLPGVQQGFLELLRQAFADALTLQQTPRP